MGEGRIGALVPDAPYQRQALVCVYGEWCQKVGAEELRARLKAAVKDAGLAKELRVTKSGCLGQCGHGPNLVFWPENVWYSRVHAEDVPEIMRVHVLGGGVVERLRYHPAKPGSNKTPDVVEAEKKTGGD